VIARHRGDLRAHTRWRPAAPAAAPPAREPAELLNELQVPEQPETGRRRPRTLIAVATVVALVVIAGHQHTSRPPTTPPLPSTPQQWVDEWTDASLQNPAHVCNHLFAPALASAFTADTGHSCAWYYTSVKSTSFRIRHVLQDGGTAAVEAQQVSAGRKWGAFTMVLSHVRGGWQAVDVVPGGSTRAR
jgi:hypothetical protein